MTRVLGLTLLALAIVLCAAPSVHAQFVIEQNLGLDTFGAKSTGQTFTPNVGIVPVPAAAATLDLTEITLYHGNYTAFAPSATTFLNIYDGDPLTTGQFLGSSSNSIDTTVGLSFHSPMVWTFDHLTLAYTIEYWAIMSSTNTTGSLDVAVPLETHDRNLGNVYTGGSGLIANLAKHSTSVDAKFKIVLTVWTDLGNDLAGTLGSPTLDGQGVLAGGGNVVTLTLANAAPNGMSGLFIGAANASLPFYGGVLVPYPNVLLVLPTGVGGGYSLPGPYPSGLPASIPLYFQIWVQDPTGPIGYTATNALMTTTQ